MSHVAWLFGAMGVARQAGHGDGWDLGSFSLLLQLGDDVLMFLIKCEARPTRLGLEAQPRVNLLLAASLLGDSAFLPLLASTYSEL